jgi:hypothetical protein
VFFHNHSIDAPLYYHYTLQSNCYPLPLTLHQRRHLTTAPLSPGAHGTHPRGRHRGGQGQGRRWLGHPLDGVRRRAVRVRALPGAQLRGQRRRVRVRAIVSNRCQILLHADLVGGKSGCGQRFVV